MSLLGRQKRKRSRNRWGNSAKSTRMLWSNLTDWNSSSEMRSVYRKKVSVSSVSWCTGVCQAVRSACVRLCKKNLRSTRLTCSTWKHTICRLHLQREPSLPKEKKCRLTWKHMRFRGVEDWASASIDTITRTGAVRSSLPSSRIRIGTLRCVDACIFLACQHRQQPTPSPAMSNCALLFTEPPPNQRLAFFVPTRVCTKHTHTHTQVHTDHMHNAHTSLSLAKLWGSFFLFG